MSSSAASSSWREILMNGFKQDNSSEQILMDAMQSLLRELFKILPFKHHKKGFFSKTIQSQVVAQTLSACIGKVMNSDSEPLVDYIGKLMVKWKMITLDGSDKLSQDKKSAVKFLHPYLPRLVIVGGGHAGLTSAIQLHEHFSIVLIDKNDYCSLKPGYPILFENVDNSEKISVKYTESLPSSVTFVRGTAKVVRPDGVFIDIVGSSSQTNLFTDHSEQNDDIKNCKYLTFDYLVVSTGCNSWRNIPTYDGSNGENKIFYADSYNMDMLKVAVNTIGQSDDSKSVVVIGGGVVGAEYFGALALAFPTKKIYMIQRSDILLKPAEDAHKIAMETFGKMKNATVLLNSQVERQSNPETLLVKSLETGEETSIKCCVCILATGNTPNTSMMKDHFASSMDASGYMNVNSSFQLFKSNSENYRNIFVLGDVNNSDSVKLMQNANFQAEKFIEIAKLIVQQEENNNLPKYETDARVMAVSLGPKYGFVIKETKVMFKSGIVIKLKGFIQSSTIKGYSKNSKK